VWHVGFIHRVTSSHPVNSQLNNFHYLRSKKLCHYPSSGLKPLDGWSKIPHFWQKEPFFADRTVPSPMLNDNCADKVNA
jgi:hypothetical protein